MSRSGSVSCPLIIGPHSLPPSTPTNHQMVPAPILDLHSLWFSSKNLGTGSSSELSGLHLSTVQKQADLTGEQSAKDGQRGIPEDIGSGLPAAQWVPLG